MCDNACRLEDSRTTAAAAAAVAGHCFSFRLHTYTHTHTNYTPINIEKNLRVVNMTRIRNQKESREDKKISFLSCRSHNQTQF